MCGSVKGLGVENKVISGMSNQLSVTTRHCETCGAGRSNLLIVLGIASSSYALLAMTGYFLSARLSTSFKVLCCTPEFIFIKSGLS